MNSDISRFELYLARRDRTALGELFASHYPAVHRVVLHMVHDSFLANDLTQATFLQALRAGERHRPTASFRRWLLAIAVNEVRQHFRRRTPRTREDWLFEAYQGCTLDGDVSEEASRREFEQKLEQALERLPAKLKEPLVLRYYEELGLAEIGDVLGLARTTVQARLQRALGRLRREFRASGSFALLPLIDRFVLGPQGSALLATPGMGSAAGVWIGGLLMKHKAIALAALVLLFATVCTLFLDPLGGLPGSEGDDLPGPVPETARVAAEREPVALETGARIRRSSAGVTRTTVRPAIFGRVVEEAGGRAIPGAELQFFDFERGVIQALQSDASGAFELLQSARRASVFHLVIARDGYGKRRFEKVQAGEEPQVFALRAAHVIRGRVIGKADGRPIPRYRIGALPIAGKNGRIQNSHTRLYQQRIPRDLLFREPLAVEDPSGYFELGDLDAGRYALVVIAPGHLPTACTGESANPDGSFGLEARPFELAPDVLVRLPRRGILRIAVRDAVTGSSIPDAAFVEVVRARDAHVRLPIEPLQVGADGVAELPIALDDRGFIAYMNVEVSKPGYAPWSRGFGGLEDGHLLTAILGRSGRVQGTVLDAAGRPAAGAAVLVERELDGALLSMTFTDEQGSYRTKAIEARCRCVLHCLDGTFRKVLGATSFELEYAEMRRIDFNSPGAGCLFGRISILGKSVDQALVGLSDGPLPATISSGEDGRYRFVALPAGRYSLFINAGNESRSIYLTHRVSLTEGEQRELSFDLGRQIQGIAFCVETGAPIGSEDQIELCAQKVGADGEVARYCADVGDGGRFNLWLDSPGIYEITAPDTPEYALLDPPRIDLSESDIAENVELFLHADRQDGTIRLAIHDAMSGDSVLEGQYHHVFKITGGAAVFDGGRIIEDDCGLGTHHLRILAPRHVPMDLDIEITPLRKDVEFTVKLQRATAVRVVSLQPGGVGERAGIAVGDILRQIGAQAVCNREELHRAETVSATDQSVELLVTREGSDLRLRSEGGELGIEVENDRGR